MKTMMQYYQEKFKGETNLKSYAKRNGKLVRGDKSTMCMVVDNNVKYIEHEQHIPLPKNVYDGDILYIKDSNIIIYKVFKKDPVYMIYDKIRLTVEFIRVDKLMPDAPYRLNGKIGNRTSATNCISDGILFALDTPINYDTECTCSTYMDMAESMIKRFVSINVPGTDEYLYSHRESVKTLIETNINMLIRFIPELETSRFYNTLINMSNNYKDGRIPLYDMKSNFQDIISKWIEKYGKSIIVIMKSSLELVDIARYSFFTKYSENPIVGHPVDKKPFGGIKFVLELLPKYHSSRREDIEKIIVNRSDSILKYSRLIMYTDPEIKKSRKDISLVNISVYGDTIELIYEKSNPNKFYE